MGVFYPYIDLHSDALYQAWRCGADDIFQMNGSMSDVSADRAGGCKLQLYAIYMPDLDKIDDPAVHYPGDDIYIQRLLEIFKQTCQGHNDRFAPALTMQDVAHNAAAGKLSGMLSMEDGRAVRGSFERLRDFYQLGVRILGLTWNHPNCFGSPNSFDPAEMAKGLTAFGKDALPCMEDLGMLVDVSHLSDGGFWDVVKISKRPFLASHSNCRTLNPHPRSMTDEMIRALADCGGIMGLNFYPAFLTQDIENVCSTVDAMAAQLRHRINVGGLGCAAIGTDFDGIDGNLEIASAAQMPTLFEELEKRGFSFHEIDQITHKNAERLLSDVLG